MEIDRKDGGERRFEVIKGGGNYVRKSSSQAFLNDVRQDSRLSCRSAKRAIIGVSKANNYHGNATALFCVRC